MVVMITGASRGIGFELVRYFAGMKNIQVLALTRQKVRLHALLSETLDKTEFEHLHIIDFHAEEFLTKPEQYRVRLPKEIDHIDVLINNAAKLIKKSFVDTSASEAETLFRVNCIAPAMLIKAFIPLMKGYDTSHVVNIGSMGGFQGSKKFSGMAWYSASKSALACLTECLNEELHDSGIALNCLALGAVQTEMLAEAFPGYDAPVQPREMAEFIGSFALQGHKYLRGKVIPVALSNP
jgi:short-subunit dehydrogenase